MRAMRAYRIFGFIVFLASLWAIFHLTSDTLILASFITAIFAALLVISPEALVGFPERKE